MRSVLVGVLVAFMGTLSMSIAMILWKSSSEFEGHLPWWKRTRFLIGTFMGVIMNATLDGIAFSMTPLTLIAPMQGLTIALTVLFSALGLGGYVEDVNSTQWRAIAGTIVGLILCSWYGPQTEAEKAWWPLIRHYHNPWWHGYMVVSFSLVIYSLVEHRYGVLLAKHKGSVKWTVITATACGLSAGMLQTQLKVFAQMLASMFGIVRPQVACREAYPGFCRYGLKAGDCPSVAETFAPDWICYLQTVTMGQTVEAWPVHPMLHWNGYMMIPTAVMQLQATNIWCARRLEDTDRRCRGRKVPLSDDPLAARLSAPRSCVCLDSLESNNMAVSVPIFSTAVLLGTIVAGTLYFDEVSQMGSPPAFALGATITVAALVALAHEKGRKEQEKKARAAMTTSPLLRPGNGAEEGSELAGLKAVENFWAGCTHGWVRLVHSV